MRARFSMPLDGHSLHTNPDAAYLPGIDPYDHQIATRDVARRHDEFVLVNSAPTGSGKTWSWNYIVGEDNIDTIALYPRNTLVKDQERALTEFFERFYPDTAVSILAITADELRAKAAATNGSNDVGATLLKLLNHAHRTSDVVILLTNPDLFTITRKDMYRGNAVKNALNRFEMVVCDEFHMAGPKQRNTLIHLLTEMYTRDNQFTNLSKLMFLSATPEPRVEETFRTHLDDMVNYVSLPCTAGWKPYSDIDPDGPYRTVMPPVSLDIVESNNFQADAAIIEEFGRVCNWCRQGDRTLIIVDSLAEVNNLYTRFNRELDSLNVERISGLHTENKRAKLDRFDLMISNSAVEAGIDFDIDRLLMSAVDGRSLLQRLGRIRNKDPTGRDPWPVTCYVKGDLVKALQTLPPTPRERVTRPGFAAAVTDRYAFRELPAMFATTYSAAELYHHSMARAEQFAVDDRREYERRTLALLERTMFDAVGESFDHDALASIYRQQDTQLLDHLQTYRDAGFQSLLYDTTATTPEQSIKTYNTLTLPTQADVRFVTKETFYEYAPESQHDVVEYKSRFTNGYALYFGPRNNKGDDERGVLRLVPSGALRVEIEKPVDERQPVVSSGYTLAFDEHDPTVGLPALNDELRETSIIAYPVNDSAYMVKHRNNLSPFFSTMELRDVRGQVCATLGYDALYMHCYDRATAE